MQRTLIVWILQNADPAAGSIRFRLTPGAVKTIGCASPADFVMDAGSLVSRLHCRLSATADHLEVIDLASTNGTFVNGEPVTQASLVAGDRLRVGRVELKVAKRAHR
jgi:pSer/pThr/pTyr-binding forkhead associated (FHA) protein